MKQQFEIRQDELICKWKDLRFGYNASNLEVGCVARNETHPQTWKLIDGEAIDSYYINFHAHNGKK